MTQIWGHRGAFDFAPENTLKSFELAADMGADGVEFDIQLTKDGEIVVIHDETVDRTSNGQGYVKDFTLAELRKFNFNKRGFSQPLFAKIPTLTDVLELLKDRDIEINIELKTGVVQYDGIEQKALGTVMQYGLAERIVWSSFNHLSVQIIRGLDPKARTALLCGGGIICTGEQCEKAGAEALHCGVHQMRYTKLIDDCRKRGIKTRVYTVNSADDLQYAYQNGIDGVFTNNIKLAKELRATGG